MPLKQASVAKTQSRYLSHVASGALINFSGSITKKFLLYAYTLLLARTMAVNELGDYFIMVTVISILGLAAALGLGLGVVRFVALFTGEGRNDQARSTLWIALSIGIPSGVIFAIGLILAAPLMTDRFFDGSSASVAGLKVFAIALPFWVAAKLFNATTQGLHQMKYQVYSRDFGEQISKMAFTIIALLLGAELFGVVLANVASIAVAMVMSMWFALMILPAKREQDAGEPKPTRALLSYSTPLAFSNILGMILIWSDLLLLGYLSTSADVGFYGAAIRLGTATAIVLGAFCTVFSPVISDLCNRGKMDELKTLFQTVTRWIFVLSLPVFLVLAFFAVPIMKIFGAEFAAGGTALVLLALGKLFDAGSGPIGHMVMMSGRSRLEVINVATALAVNVMLCFILIPRIGIVGAGIANVSTYATVNLLRALEIWFSLRIQAYNRSYLRPLLAGAVASVLVAGIRYLWLDEPGLVQLLALAAGLVGVYLIVMIAFGLNEQDRTILKTVRSKLPVIGSAG